MSIMTVGLDSFIAAAPYTECCKVQTASACYKYRQLQPASSMHLPLLGAVPCRPSEMFSQPDPSAFKLTPPFPLHEESLSVNGIK